jgi:hypothetical protein
MINHSCQNNDLYICICDKINMLGNFCIAKQLWHVCYCVFNNYYYSERNEV